MSLGLLLSLAIVECSQAVEAGGVRSGGGQKADSQLVTGGACA